MDPIKTWRQRIDGARDSQKFLEFVRMISTAASA